MKLTELEKQTVRNGEPIHFQQDDVECVVMRADLFHRLRGVVDEGLSSSVVGRLVEQSMSDFDADDPLLESYQVKR